VRKVSLNGDPAARIQRAEERATAGPCALDMLGCRASAKVGSYDEGHDSDRYSKGQLDSTGAQQ
jgi:hypothetical protein